MKNTITKSIFVLLIALTISISACAQQTAEKYYEVTNYLLYLPQEYNANDTTKNWPLVMFLHGVGEVGNDVNVVRGHGLAKLVEEGRQFPFIIVSPQAPQRGWNPTALYKLLNDVQEKYHVDSDRIYLTGLSMGGYGTWSMASSYPTLFAAILPICGGGYPEMAPRLKNMPIWNFHGAKDDIVRISESEKIIDALKPINNKLKYTIYPDGDHYVWDQTYRNDSIYTWMLSHTRFKNKEVAVNPQILEKYAGTYIVEENEAKVIVRVENGKLFIEFPGNDTPVQIKAVSDTNFFMDENDTNYIVFKLNTKNVVDGLEFEMYNNMYLRKI